MVMMRSHARMRAIRRTDCMRAGSCLDEEFKVGACVCVCVCRLVMLRTVLHWSSLSRAPPCVSTPPPLWP